MWLRCDFSNRAFWPSENGEFNLSSHHDFAHLIVEGPPAVSPHLPAAEVVNFGSPGPSTIAGLPALTMSALPKRGSYSGFQSVVSMATTTSKRKGSAVALKIIVAKMTRPAEKIAFEKREQIFVSITETTATLPYILAQVKEHVGDDYIIVTCDGLELKESTGTEGMYR